jgi:hypothetical protein
MTSKAQTKAQKKRKRLLNIEADSQVSDTANWYADAGPPVVATRAQIKRRRRALKDSKNTPIVDSHGKPIDTETPEPTP